MSIRQPSVLPVSTQIAFQELQKLVQAANRANRHEAAPLSVDTLCVLSDCLMLVEPAKKKRNYTFRYVGDSLVEAYQDNWTGMTFADLKDKCEGKSDWKDLKRCLTAWLDSREKEEPHLLQSVAKLGVHRGKEITRLILPIYSRGRVSMLAGAIMYRDITRFGGGDVVSFPSLPH